MDVKLQRNYACYVEATEIQVHISSCHPVCVHSNHSFCCRCLLGFWWSTPHTFKCLLTASTKSMAWCCSNPNAYSPGLYNVVMTTIFFLLHVAMIWHDQYFSFYFAVHNIWLCMHSTIFCVGESGGNAWYKEHMFEGTCPVACGDTNMVLGNYISFLWSHQLSCGGSLGQLHRLHHPCFSPYAHL